MRRSTVPVTDVKTKVFDLRARRVVNTALFDAAAAAFFLAAAFLSAARALP